MRNDARQRNPVVLEDGPELEDVGGDVAALQVVVLDAPHHRRALLPRDGRWGGSRRTHLWAWGMEGDGRTKGTSFGEG